MKRQKIIRIALDRKTGGTVGFSKKAMEKSKDEIYKGRKRYTGFTNSK